jgi:6,7-dimethyl-8-ribityllumazine synthase
MSSRHKNLSSYNKTSIPSAKGLRIAIVVSEWNEEITEALFSGCYTTLTESGCNPKQIHRINVPGSYELPAGANLLATKKKYDAIVCLGCVIQGETRHFEFICNAVASGLVAVTLKHNVPVIFGVLTPDTIQQAKDRSGGKHGNKGVEAAITAIKMATLNEIKKSK